MRQPSSFHQWKTSKSFQRADEHIHLHIRYVPSDPIVQKGHLYYQFHKKHITRSDSSTKVFENTAHMFLPMNAIYVNSIRLNARTCKGPGGGTCSSNLFPPSFLAPLHRIHPACSLERSRMIVETKEIIKCLVRLHHRC